MDDLFLEESQHIYNGSRYHQYQIGMRVAFYYVHIYFGLPSIIRCCLSCLSPSRLDTRSVGRLHEIHSSSFSPRIESRGHTAAA